MAENASEAQRKDSLPKSLFVLHMARSPAARTSRRLRPGNRQGFLLGNGVRVRRKGKRRLTEISMATVLENLPRLIEGVKHQHIRVSLDGDGKHVVTLEQLMSLGSGSATVPQRPASPPPQDPPEDSDDQGEGEGEDEGQESTDPGLTVVDGGKSDEDDSEEEGSEDDESDEEGYTEDDLKSMRRDDLNVLAAEEFGIEDPGSYPNKGSLIEAILESGGEE